MLLFLFVVSVDWKRNKPNLSLFSTGLIVENTPARLSHQHCLLKLQQQQNALLCFRSNNNPLLTTFALWLTTYYYVYLFTPPCKCQFNDVRLLFPREPGYYCQLGNGSFHSFQEWGVVLCITWEWGDYVFGFLLSLFPYLSFSFFLFCFV